MPLDAVGRVLWGGRRELDIGSIVFITCRIHVTRLTFHSSKEVALVVMECSCILDGFIPR